MTTEPLKFSSIESETTWGDGDDGDGGELTIMAEALMDIAESVELMAELMNRQDADAVRRRSAVSQSVAFVVIVLLGMLNVISLILLLRGGA